MDIVKIVSRDPDHVNRLFDVNDVEYSHPLALSIPELPFFGVINAKRRMIIGTVLFESSIDKPMISNINIEDLLVL